MSYWKSISFDTVSRHAAGIRKCGISRKSIELKTWKNDCGRKSISIDRQAGSYAMKLQEWENANTINNSAMNSASVCVGKVTKFVYTYLPNI